MELWIHALLLPSYLTLGDISFCGPYFLPCERAWLRLIPQVTSSFKISWRTVTCHILTCARKYCIWLHRLHFSQAGAGGFQKEQPFAENIAFLSFEERKWNAKLRRALLLQRRGHKANLLLANVCFQTAMSKYSPKEIFLKPRVCFSRSYAFITYMYS